MELNLDLVESLPYPAKLVPEVVVLLVLDPDKVVPRNKWVCIDRRCGDGGGHGDCSGATRLSRLCLVVGGAKRGAEKGGLETA